MTHPLKGKPRAPQIPKSLPIEEAKRLVLLKVLPKIKVNERGCWVWQGWCNPQWGYGNTSWRGEVWGVHRLMWTVMRGEIPADKILCHRCDNPPCCNPDHLWLGTDQENHQDKAAKGRHHYGKLRCCKWGHEFTPENTRITKVEGRPDLFRRQCIECARIRHNKKWHSRTPEERARIYAKRNERRRAQSTARRETEVHA